MRVLTATFLLLIFSSSVSTYTEPGPPFRNSPFDSYGVIDWENEKARLDSFAIQLTQERKGVGAILVYDKTRGCPGEAKARAQACRAKLDRIRRSRW